MRPSVNLKEAGLSFAGLTLMELLIASSILVVIMLTIYSAFHTGMFSYRNIEQNVEIYQTARQILERINLDLRNCFAYSQDYSNFLGDSNEVSFLSLVDRYQDKKIVQEYAFIFYKLENERLTRLIRKGKDSLNENSQIIPEEMPSFIEEISFDYGYMDPAEQTLKFKDSWGIEEIEQERKSLPIAVRVNLKIKNQINQIFQRTIYLTQAEIDG